MEIIIPLVLVFGLFYLILLRPVLQTQRRRKRDIANLRVGDQVLTSGGFLATVKEVRVPEEGPTVLYLDLGSGLIVRALPEAVQQRVTRPEALPPPLPTPGSAGPDGSALPAAEADVPRGRRRAHRRSAVD